MLKIKFSHNYPKLWNQKTAELLAVKQITIDENTPNELIEYDCRYNKICHTAKYVLMHGHYLQLIFFGDKRIPFCTIRSYNPEKMKYYYESIGQDFEIVVKDRINERA
jgi:hypothetical protein